jgi:hypothetical protein
MNIEIEGFKSKTIEFTDQLGRQRITWSGIAIDDKRTCYAEIRSTSFRCAYMVTVAVLTNNGPYYLCTQNNDTLDELEVSHIDKAISIVKNIDIKSFYDEIDDEEAFFDTI